MKLWDEYLSKDFEYDVLDDSPLILLTKEEKNFIHNDVMSKIKKQPKENGKGC